MKGSNSNGTEKIIAGDEVKMEVSTEEAAQKWLATAQFKEILASDTSHKVGKSG